MIRPDQQAALDQVQADMLGHARLTRVIYDAYIAEGFSDLQALRLTIAYLDRFSNRGDS